MPAAVTALLLLAACTGSTPDAATPPNGQTVRVIEVLDGDSLRIGGDEVRMLGINTPEKDECFADAARRRTTELVGGRTVVLVAGGEDRDQFGRLLRYVYLPDGTFINALLVEEGYALSMTGDEPQSATLRHLEGTAFAAGAGMWGHEACGPAVPGLAEVTTVVYDAPGRDEDDPNGEWVEITDPGPDRVDLGGWTLRDESSRHRYVFPAGFSLGPGSTLRVLSGCGEDDTTTLHWCAGEPVWNNGGDTAYLFDPSGNLVGRFAY